MDVADALDSRDVGRLIGLVRQHTGASQNRIAVQLDLTQGRVSEIVNGKRRVENIDVLLRLANGLDMPTEARFRLGLAPRPGERTASPGPDDGGCWSPETATDQALRAGHGGEQDSVRRRDVLSAAGTAVAGMALVAPALATALTSYSAITGQAEPNDPPDFGRLRVMTATAKRQYQACRYREVAALLPTLLSVLRFAVNHSDGEDRRHALALSAHANQIAASILLKAGDTGLAGVAAERSMCAAEASESALAIGSSARAVTHTLMDSGHTGRAASFAVQAAQAMQSRCHDDPQMLSVYGSLLLRGAAAAATDQNRSGTFALVDEAGAAARRLGADGNHYWTAFGPTNVLLHRVNLASKLGDAGAAISYAKQIDPAAVDVTERRAMLFVDVARAFAQWRKYDRAYLALRRAEAIAPQEIGRRRSVLRLAVDVAESAPPSTAAYVRDLIDRARRWR